MDIKDIKDLILAIDKTSIEKVEIEEKDIKIKIYKNTEKTNIEMNTNQNDTHKSQTIELKEEIYIEAEETEDFFIAKSPIVGVYYSAPSPNAEAFVSVGQKVKKGDTLCIVEAMKIMNEIEAEIDGEIVEIYAKDEDVIQYGQALLKLRRI